MKEKPSRVLHIFLKYVIDWKNAVAFPKPFLISTFWKMDNKLGCAEIEIDHNFKESNGLLRDIPDDSYTDI